MSTKKIIGCFAVTISMTSLLNAQDINDAKHLIESERYSSAEALLEKTMESNQPEINYLLVKTYLEQDKTDEAGKYVTQRLQPVLNTDTDPLNRIAWARYQLHTGNTRVAEEIFASIFNNRKNQKDPSLLLAMAEVAIEEEKGDAGAALHWLALAEKRDKRDPAIDIARGLAYRKLGDASNAFLSFQNAVNKDPKNLRAHYLTGKIFTAQKNPEIYIQHFMKAFEIDPTYAPVLEELYEHYYYRDVKLAKMYLEKYIANSDSSLQNEYYMTDILFLNAEYQKAINAATAILDKEKAKAQSRLYKLIAYSYAGSGDSVKALSYMNDYFAKQVPARIIAPDLQFIAQLTERAEGQEEAAIAYYSMAVEVDTITVNKEKYAIAVADLYKKRKDYGNQAKWLGKIYGWKEKSTNIDLFNWGLAYYKANDFPMTDSVFSIYSARYPDDIYGYYWRAQANASIDTSMTDSLAIPFYQKVVEIAEKENKEAYKKMLLKAYGYLGGFEANITKNYTASIGWFEKYLAIENENAEISGYIEMLRKWIAQEK